MAGSRTRPRHGFGLLEGLIVLGLLSILLVWIQGARLQARRDRRHRFEPDYDVQTATRRSLSALFRELQECIEFVHPPAGCTDGYFLARDKTNHVLVGFLVESTDERTGEDTLDLMVTRHDVDGGGRRDAVTTVEGVSRATFTSLSPGLLQVRLDLEQGDRTYPLLTSIRAFNHRPGGGL